MSRPLEKKDQPELVEINLDVDPSLIDNVKKELSKHAKTDNDKCFGYFPGMSGRSSIIQDLPACKELAKSLPTLKLSGKKLDFNFIRLALIDQPTISPFHLDSDSSTALTGDLVTLSERLVWRLLINLNDKKPRKLVYLDVQPDTKELDFTQGYIAYPKKLVVKDKIKRVTLPKRKGNKAWTVLFCASRVLHAGEDTEGGHFVAGYGLDE